MEQEQQNIKQQELEENYEEVKAKEQKELHAQNLLQEASETINQCTECGQCKGSVSYTHLTLPTTNRV